MKKLVFVFLAVVASLGAAAQTAEHPFVEQGKVWHYTRVDAFNPTEDEIYPFDLRIEGTEIIDGLEYAKVYGYLNNDTEPLCGTPYCYLRETPEGNVYSRSNKDYKYVGFQILGTVDLDDEENPEYLLISLQDLKKGGMTFVEWYTWEYDEVTYVEEEYMAPCGFALKSWRPEPQMYEPDICLIEGVGYVFPNGGESILLNSLSLWTYMYKPGITYLLSVEDGNGNVLYRDKDINGLANVVSHDDAPAEYFDLMGRRVAEPGSGMYICRRGVSTSKVLMR